MGFMIRTRLAFFCRTGSAATLLALLALPGRPSGPAAHKALTQEPRGPVQAAKFLEGRLLASGDTVSLSTGGHEVRLGSESPFLMHTLADPRLEGREVRLEGAVAADGSFRAEHLWIIKEGKLHRVRYYCHVCNIAAIEPGPCVCCQRWTELEEIPVDEVTPDMVLVP